MAKLKGVHASKKTQATAYKAKNQAGKNKLIKLQRHLKKHPGDAQAMEAQSSARDYKGRTAPKRVGARLTPFINEKDRIALAEVMIREKQISKEEAAFASRSVNLLSGRISAVGKRVQAAVKFSKGVRHQAEYDRKGIVFPKPKMTKAERDLAKARAMGKTPDEAGVSKAKQKKLKTKARKAA